MGNEACSLRVVNHFTVPDRRAIDLPLPRSRNPLASRPAALSTRPAYAIIASRARPKNPGDPLDRVRQVLCTRGKCRKGLLNRSKVRGREGAMRLRRCSVPSRPQVRRATSHVSGRRRDIAGRTSDRAGARRAAQRVPVLSLAIRFSACAGMSWLGVACAMDSSSTAKLPRKRRRRSPLHQNFYTVRLSRDTFVTLGSPSRWARYRARLGVVDLARTSAAAKRDPRAPLEPAERRPSRACPGSIVITSNGTSGFPLERVVAVLSPSRPIIAYHCCGETTSRAPGSHSPFPR